MGDTPEFSAHDLVRAIRGAGPAPEGVLIVGKPAKALSAAEPEQAQLVVLAGFLGDDVKVPGREDAKWTLLFTDLGFNDWMIVEPGGVVWQQGAQNMTMYGIPYDIIWVKATAFVASGSGPPDTQAQFLTGDFMRAADFDTGMTGGTLDAPTGLFCRAPRGSGVRCCTRKSS
jgi:hypothetical protein